MKNKIKVVVENLKNRNKNSKKKKRKYIKYVAGFLIGFVIGGFHASNQEPEQIEQAKATLEHSIDEEVTDYKKQYMEIKDEIKEIKINDNISLKEDSKIYNNQYNAITDESAKDPYFNNNKARKIEKISVVMEDGSVKQASTEEEKDQLVKQGGKVEAYLTSNENGLEGYYKAEDAVKINSKDELMKLKLLRDEFESLININNIDNPKQMIK